MAMHGHGEPATWNPVPQPLGRARIRHAALGFACRAACGASFIPSSAELARLGEPSHAVRARPAPYTGIGRRGKATRCVLLRHSGRFPHSRLAWAAGAARVMMRLPLIRMRVVTGHRVIARLFTPRQMLRPGDHSSLTRPAMQWLVHQSGPAGVRCFAQDAVRSSLMGRGLLRLVPRRCIFCTATASLPALASCACRKCT